jgi:iron(III) transport system permease protein
MEKTYQPRPANGEGHLIIELGGLRLPLLAIVGLLFTMAIAMPMLVLFAGSASVQIYAQALAKAGDSLVRSLVFSAIGASILTVLGFFLGYLVYTKTFRFWRGVDTLSIFLFALPGTVIGIGLVSLWNRPSTNFIYQTFAIVILGYIAQYSALTSRITVAALAQIPPSMEEAAQSAGAGWFRRVILIVAPLAKRALIGAWLAGFIFCLRDTSISMLVYPPGSDTFTVRTFTLMANNPVQLIAALCAILILATLLPLGMIAIFLKKGRFG